MNIDIEEAKTKLDELVELLSPNKVCFINICENGIPLVTLRPYRGENGRIGAGKGILKPISFDEYKEKRITEEDLFGA